MWSLLVTIKQVTILIFISCLSLTLLSGCIEKTESLSSSSSAHSTNLSPIINVTFQSTSHLHPFDLPDHHVDVVVYENEQIHFDASESYDPDGWITQVEWIVDYPDTIKNGTTVTHTYIPNFQQGNVYITEVIVTVTDNNGSLSTETFLLGVLRKTLTCYLDGSEVTTATPHKSSVLIRPSLNILRSSPGTEFIFSTPLALDACAWNITLHVTRPRFCFLKTISVSLVDHQGITVSNSEWSQPLFSLWQEKTITFSGEITTSTTLNHLSIKITGLSLRKSVELSIGGETPSILLFEFIR